MLKNSMPGSVVSLAIVIDETSPYQPFQQDTSLTSREDEYFPHIMTPTLLFVTFCPI